MNTPILEMKNITKKFGSVTALNGVNLEVFPGEIRGLIGENGSGKSTISSIAAGMQKATSGQMLYEGKAWEPESMIDALNKGIVKRLNLSTSLPERAVSMLSPKNGEVSMAARKFMELIRSAD